MPEEIVYAEINERILIDFLLDHQVPNAESLAFVHIGSPSVIEIVADNGTVRIIRVNIGNHIVSAAAQRIAVEHMDVVIPPKAAAPAALLITVINTDINLMLRFIQKLPRHVGVTFVHRMQVSITEPGFPMLRQGLLEFPFDTCNFGTANVAEAVNQVGCMGKLSCAVRRRFIVLRIKVHQVACIINGHIIFNFIVKHCQL